MGAHFLSPVSPSTDLHLLNTGSLFGYVACKDDLGVGRPGFRLPYVRNSFTTCSSGRVVKLRLHPRVSARDRNRSRRFTRAPGM